MYNSAATSRLVKPLATKATTSRSVFCEVERRAGLLRGGGNTGGRQIGFDPAQERVGADRCQKVVGGVQGVQCGPPLSSGQQDPTQGVVQTGPIKERVVAA